MITATRSTKRLLGMDVARAIAIGGMALVHFVMVLSSASMDESLWASFFERLSGRPATIFMILAGIGVSLRFVGKSDRDSIEEGRKRLTRRGWFFLIVGFLNLALWPGDILRVYGVAYLFAAFLAFSSRKALLIWSFSVFGLFLLAMVLFDFETNWNFETLEYANLWTVEGGTMNLFFNGFRAVLPWLGVMFLGMWIGRFDLRSEKTRWNLFLCGLLAWCLAEALSFGLLTAITPFIQPSEIQDVAALLGTGSLPPMPLFLMSSGGLAIALIMLCIHVCQRWPGYAWDWMANAGQMAFTWYIAHIFVVIGVGIACGFRGDVSLPTAYVVAGVFFFIMCATSVIYRRFFKFGPLEWVMRKLTG